jgi:hypothetical protein
LRVVDDRSAGLGSRSTVAAGPLRLVRTPTRQQIPERGTTGRRAGGPQPRNPAARRGAGHTGQTLHGGAEIAEHRRRIDLGVAADGHDGARPDQDHLGLGSEIVGHLDHGGADAGPDHDHVRFRRSDRFGQAGRIGGVADDFVAFALEDEPEQPAMLGRTLGDDHTDVVLAHASTVPRSTFSNEGSVLQVSRTTVQEAARSRRSIGL